MKVLVTRTDRMGDVLLSLPTLKRLREYLPDAEIHFHASENYFKLLKPFLENLNIRFVSKSDFEKDRFYHGVLFLYWDFRLATYFINSKVRVGVYSKPFSFLLLSAGIFQKRSKALKNEAVYNLDLLKMFLRKLGVKPRFSFESPEVLIPFEEKYAVLARGKLLELGLTDSDVFTLVHPGMGGSALNLSALRYVELIDSLNKTGKHLLLSIGPNDEDKKLGCEIIKLKPNLKVLTGLELPVLREVFRLAELVVAPSTGPLHLAHFVGTKTIGIFSPVLSQHPRRWQPWGGKTQCVVIQPDVNCPARKKCIGSRCSKYFCLDSLDFKGLLRA